MNLTEQIKEILRELIIASKCGDAMEILAISSAAEKIEQLFSAENKSLREALEFYADSDNWETDGDWATTSNRFVSEYENGFDKARKVLAELDR